MSGTTWQRLVLRPGAVAGDADRAGEYCYLIEHGLLANYINVDNHRWTCVGLAGPGEFAGLAALFGRPATENSSRSSAIGPVQLLRVPLAELRMMLHRSPALLDICMQQLQARLTDIQHVAACNARHLLPARCSHWLLRLQSRLGGTLPLTHEFVASILGVRRAGITVTLQSLQRDGVIRQQRGSIIITDEARLRQSACSCPTYIECPAFPLPAQSALSLAAPFAAEKAGGPRIWVEKAIQAQALPDDRPGDHPLARIEATLQVCHAVMQQTQEMLAP